MDGLLSKHPLYIHIQNQNGPIFSIGEITMNISLLNSPLLNWDGIVDSKKSKEDVSKIIQPIYLQNMQSNPWFQQYETIFKHQMTI
jgi:hypothetical protein